jgi:hypothetical protein
MLRRRQCRALNHDGRRFGRYSRKRSLYPAGGNPVGPRGGLDAVASLPVNAVSWGRRRLRQGRRRRQRRVGSSLTIRAGFRAPRHEAQIRRGTKMVDRSRSCLLPCAVLLCLAELAEPPSPPRDQRFV